MGNIHGASERVWGRERVWCNKQMPMSVGAVGKVPRGVVRRLKERSVSVVGGEMGRVCRMVRQGGGRAGEGLLCVERGDVLFLADPKGVSASWPRAVSALRFQFCALMGEGKGRRDVFCSLLRLSVT